MQTHTLKQGALWSLILAGVLILSMAGYSQSAEADWLPAAAGYRESLPQATGKIGPITFAPKESDGAPVGPTDHFGADTKTVFMFFDYDVNQVSDGDVLTTVWYHDGQVVDQRGGPMSELFDNMALLASLTGSAEPQEGRVWLMWPDGKDVMKPGLYRVEMGLNGQPVQSAEFTVGQAAASTPASPQTVAGKLGAITFAKGESNGDPKDPTNRFDAGTKQIYGFFDFTDVPKDAVIGGSWYQGGLLLFKQTATLSQVFQGKPPQSGTLWFHINQPLGSLPGNYRLELSVDDQPAQSGQFVVAPRDKNPTLANVAFAGTVNGTGAAMAYPVAANAVYPAGTSSVNAVFDYFGMGPKVKWGWQLSREGTVLDGANDLIWDGKAAGAYALPLKVPNEPGVYDLDLFANGKWAAASSFIIGDPAPPQDRLIQSDDFSNPESGWGAARSPNGSVSNDNGQYSVLIDKVDTPAWGTSGQVFGDVVAEVEATALNVPPGTRDDSYGYYGIVVRFQDADNYYAFFASPSGNYGVFHMDNGRVVWDQRLSQAPLSIIPDGFRTSRLRVLSHGSELRFYVNGLLVATLFKPRWADGQAGVLVISAGRSPATFGFDNWRAWKLPGAAASPVASAQATEAAPTEKPTAAAPAQKPAAQAPSKPATTSTSSGKTGIHLEVAPWVPQRDSGYGWWGIVRAGDKPDKPVQKTNTDSDLNVPPGQYDVYWNQDYDHRDSPLLLASGIEVKDKQLVTVGATSGLKLEVAPWVPKRDASYGWWGVVRAGDKPNQRVQWTNAADALLVAPGTYDVYWNQDYDHQDSPLLLAAGVELKDGQAPTVSATSGLKLKVPANTPPLDTGYGWWGVVAAGAAPDQRIQWDKGRLDQPLLVAPGTYDIAWKQDYSHPPQTVAQGVKVEAGNMNEVQVEPPKG